MKNKTIKYLFVVLLILATVVFAVDYFNFFSKIGLNMLHLNWDLISIVINNIVVITLFFITYILIDSRNIQKDKNKKSTADLILIEIYEKCKDMVRLFSKEENREKAVKNCDGNKLIFEDNVHLHYLKYPFENESLIYDFASSGIIPKDVFEDFLSTKKEYQEYINTALILYDRFEHFKGLEINLYNHLNNNINKLNNGLNNN